MHLDLAKEAFDYAPSHKTAAYLLRTAVQYHDDGMIEDTTLHLHIERVAEWLLDE